MNSGDETLYAVYIDPIDGVCEHRFHLGRNGGLCSDTRNSGFLPRRIGIKLCQAVPAL